MTTETLMTDQAATTTEGQAASQGAASTTTEGQAPAAGAPGAQTQQTTEGQTSTEAAKADESSSTEGDAGKPAEKAGAPEKYEFTQAEAFDAKVIGEFSEVAKELNLPQDAAQKILDKVAPVIQARQAEAMEAARTEWVNTAKADKEFGGDKLAENLAVAKKALDQFGTPELRTLLNESGLGNHPEVIRMMFRAGKAISEDRFVAGGVGGPSASRDAARALYPSQQS